MRRLSKVSHAQSATVRVYTAILIGICIPVTAFKCLQQHPKLETVEWLNALVRSAWISIGPSVARQLMQTANEALEKVATMLHCKRNGDSRGREEKNACG